MSSGLLLSTTNNSNLLSNFNNSESNGGCNKGLKDVVGKAINYVFWQKL
jgi:hypothetical protein